MAKTPFRVEDIGRLRFDKESKRFIELVKKYPSLWDASIPEGRKKSDMDNSWCLVAKELNIPEPSIKILKSRWRLIRNSYNKSRRAPKGSDYHLAAYLKFLDNAKSKKKNKPVDYSDEPEEISIYCTPFLFNESYYTNNGINEMLDPTLQADGNDDNEQHIDENSSARTEIQPKANEEVDCSRLKTKSTNSHDETYKSNSYFLKSLLCGMNSMNPHQNRKFRYKAIGLIERILSKSNADVVEM